MRIDLRSRGIVEVSSAFAALTGGDRGRLVGRPHGELWPAAERAAIERRLDDVVLLGRDAFGCVAFTPDGGEPCFVELEARYSWRGGRGIEVSLRPVVERRFPRPAAAQAAPSPATPPAVPPTLADGPPGGPAPDPAPAPTSRASGEAAPPTPQPTSPASPASPTPPPTPPPVRPPVAPAEGADAAYLVMSALAAVDATALFLDADATIASATPGAERLLGMPIARLRGRRLDELVSLAEVARLALAAAQVGQARQSVAAALVSDGRQVALEWIPGPGPGTGFLALCGERAESEDAERLRFQSRLVSFVAHDVRNSLAAVYCGLRSLADVTPVTAPERATVDKALAETQRASRIVDDVLAVSRPGRLTRVSLDLAGLLRDTLNRFRPRAAANGIELLESLEEGLPVAADLSQLERAFANLVENALDATPRFGRLTVSLAREDRGRPGLRVQFTDTGVGIAPDLRANVFEPFVTGKAGGTGLGLAITRRVILDHEGQIDVQSEVGRGTTFTLWLPSP